MNLRRPPLRRLVVWAAWIYLAVLAIAVFLLRFVGESWWVTGMALYFPRVLFLLPSLVLVPCAFALKLSRVLYSQLVAGAIVLFPLMGFVLPQPRANANGPQIRLLSYNVNSCAAGAERLAELVARHDPDVVMFQELCRRSRDLAARLGETYPTVKINGQFLLASRYPWIEPTDPVRGNPPARIRDERFARYELQTSLGPIAFYNLHPLSPRWAFYAAKGMRVRTSFRNGTILRGGAAEDSLRANFELRERQLQAAVELANGDSVPRVLAGDTNLPTLSSLVSRHLASYQDGFERAGWGFGYSYPGFMPWMRIDRVFASEDLRFVSFQTGCGNGSDHRCVIAQLERAAE